MDRPLQIEHTFVVENECYGWRLDRFLKKKIPRLSRVRVQRVIRGECWVNGRACKPSQIVSPGQKVVFRRPAPVEPDVPRTLPVLHTDPDFYAFDKPAGLPMHPTAKYHYSTLTAVLREVYPSEPLQIAHRLDLETSGIVLVARSRESAIILKRAFARRKVQKRYLAIVHCPLDATPLADEGVIDLPLAVQAAGIVRVKMEVREDGLPSRTRYRVLSRAGERALVECSPETGRQHQIRAHLCAIGHPIVGDKLYPDERVFAHYQDTGEHPFELGRHALHASQITFDHPSTGERVVIDSPLPAELRAFLGDLGTANI